MLFYKTVLEIFKTSSVGPYFVNVVRLYQEPPFSHRKKWDSVGGPPARACGSTTPSPAACASARSCVKAQLVLVLVLVQAAAARALSPSSHCK
jgi:hypothetical protein